MFTLEETYYFDQRVTASARLPNGSYMTEEFMASFRVVRRSEVLEIFKQRGDREGALLRSALVGWDGVQDAQGTPMPFSEENRDRLLEIPFIAAAIHTAYLAGLRQLSDGSPAETPQRLM